MRSCCQFVKVVVVNVCWDVGVVGTTLVVGDDLFTHYIEDASARFNGNPGPAGPVERYRARIVNLQALIFMREFIIACSSLAPHRHIGGRGRGNSK